MAQLFLQVQASKLKGSGIISTATTIPVQSFKDPQENNIVTADLGDKCYATLEPNTIREEIISFTGVTQNADGTADLTGVTRNLDYTTPYTQISSTGFAHAGGTLLVVSNNPQVYDDMSSNANDETITGIWTFDSTAFPKMSDGTTSPTADEELATKAYVDNTAGGTPISINRIIPVATAGETVAAGEVCYYDTTAKEWLLADSDIVAESDNVLLGIAQGAGTDGNIITGGILLYGLDSNQIGMTAGNVMYLSSTSGGISSSVGTQEVEVGIAYSATQLYFCPRFASVPTGDEKDALAGTIGIPSSSNKYVTNDDTAGTGDVVRESLLPTIKFGGDGSNGSLVITTGTTTVDLGGNAYYELNYTSVSITGDGNLAFSNPHAKGSVVVIKSQGNITLTSSSTAVIDMKSLGGSGGSGGAINASGTNGTSIDDEDFGTIVTFGALGTIPTGGAGGVVFPDLWLAYASNTSAKIRRRIISLKPGAGGGGGAGGATGTGGTSGTGGNAGDGAGALYIECGGAWNFTTGSIDLDGGDGANGVNGATATGGNDERAAGGGGGGGGGAGQLLVLYNSLTASSGSILLNGGNGGNGGNGAIGSRVTGGTTNGGGGGGGAANAIAAGGNGGNASAPSTDGNNGSAGGGVAGTGGIKGTTITSVDLQGQGGGGGGGGGGGTSVVMENTVFV